MSQQEGVIKNIVEADKSLVTLKLPAQGQIGRENIQASEVQIVVFTETHDGKRGVANAFNLLNTLFERGVTDRYVLELALEATGHFATQLAAPPSEALDSSIAEIKGHEQ